MIMIELPPELWKIICDFLNGDDLWHCRLLNRTVWDCALSKRLHLVHINIRDIADDAFIWTLQRLQASQLVHYIRSLCVTDVNMTETHSWKVVDGVHSRFIRSLREPRRRELLSFNSHPLNLAVGSATVTQFVRSLPRLTTLGIIDAEHSWDYRCLNIALLILRSCSSTLLGLITHLSKRHDHLIILHRDIHLPLLEDFRAIFACDGQEVTPYCQDEVAQEIVFFLNRHRSTLKDLALASSCSLASAHSGLMFQDINHIPNLSNIELLFCNYEDEQSGYIQHFLQRHSQTLQVLIIRTCFHQEPNDPPPSLNALKTPLPSLKTLFLQSTDSNLSFANYYSAGLWRLELTSYDGEILSDKDGDWDRLESLSVRALWLSADFFARVAVKFPSLRELSVEISDAAVFRSRDGVEDVEKFCAEMQEQSFIDSRIFSIDLKIANNRELPSSVSQVLAGAFQSLKHLNDIEINMGLSATSRVEF